MKKFASLVLFAFLLNGCDDGNLSVDNINFEDTKTLSCTTNNIIFKLKEQESLLLNIPVTAFTNEPSASIEKPIIINIDSNNQVIYRAYSGKVTTNNICDVIPPATPAVSEQWTASSGVIQMYVTAIVKTDDTDNSSRINGYNYTINFKNITFVKPNGPQTYETFPFGEYQTTVTPPTLKFDATVGQCTDSKQIYNHDTGTSITIDNIDPALIKNEVTLAPRTGLISSTTNKLLYCAYKGVALTDDYFCKTITPSTPVITETWAGIDGVSGVSGIIEVVTTTLTSNSFQHTITLKNASLQKGNSVFRLGNNYVLGQLITTTN
jgi:hypothetical protein